MTPPQTAARALRSGKCRDNGTPQQQSEQRPAKTDATSPVCFTESRGLSVGSAGPTDLFGVPARSEPSSSLAVEQVNAVRGCQQKVGAAAGPHGQNKMGPVAVSAQPAAQPEQSPKASTAAQPAAGGSAGKQSASTNIEGCAPSAIACCTHLLTIDETALS